MAYGIIFVVGVTIGAFCVALLTWEAHRKARKAEHAATTSDRQARERLQSADERARSLDTHSKELEAWAKTKAAELESRAAQVAAQTAEFEQRIVTYRELQDENAILKRDLQNIDVNLNKLHLDCELQGQRQKQLDERSTEPAERYLRETVKAVGALLSSNNFSACKERLLDVIRRCRDIGFDIPEAEEQRLVADLRTQFEKEVKLEFEREEQRRIKAQIREEEKLQREVDRELKQLERERLAIQAALDQALAAAQDKHSEEVDRLKARLAEAEEKSKRALSMAQQTKAGNIYVISNIGSFGEGVFKVGMTRRLEPKDRVRELGDASVPFLYDVHMMISCDDAPALENALHRELHKSRLNKVNPRKEFFRTDIETISRIVREHHGEVQYVADPEALEYRQSLSMSAGDAEFIEQVFDAADDDAKAIADDK